MSVVYKCYKLYSFLNIMVKVLSRTFLHSKYDLHKVELLLRSVVETSTSWHRVFMSVVRIPIQNESCVVCLRYVVYRKQFLYTDLKNALSGQI